MHVRMFTAEDEKQLRELMNQNPHNHALIQKLLDAHEFTLIKVGHEIRNSLAIIMSAMQLIQNQYPETHDFSYWPQLMDDVKFTKILLEDLSTYNTGSRLNSSLIHTSDFMNLIIASFTTTLITSPIELTSEIDENLPDFHGDSIKLHEVFLNLLRNAAEAIKSEGKIHIRCYQDGNNIITKISDNGCGIAESDMDDIFNPFITHKKDGTGLGLPIANTIVQAHLGAIDIESKPNVGTTFTVTLPIENNCG